MLQPLPGFSESQENQADVLSSPLSGNPSSDLLVSETGLQASFSLCYCQVPPARRSLQDRNAFNSPSLLLYFQQQQNGVEKHQVCRTAVRPKPPPVSDNTSQCAALGTCVRSLTDMDKPPAHVTPLEDTAHALRGRVTSIVAGKRTVGPTERTGACYTKCCGIERRKGTSGGRAHHQPTQADCGLGSSSPCRERRQGRGWHHPQGGRPGGREAHSGTILGALRAALKGPGGRWEKSLERQVEQVHDGL